MVRNGQERSGNGQETVRKWSMVRTYILPCIALLFPFLSDFAYLPVCYPSLYLAMCFAISFLSLFDASSLLSSAFSCKLLFCRRFVSQNFIWLVQTAIPSSFKHLLPPLATSPSLTSLFLSASSRNRPYTTDVRIRCACIPSRRRTYLGFTPSVVLVQFCDCLYNSSRKLSLTFFSSLLPD